MNTLNNLALMKKQSFGYKLVDKVWMVPAILYILVVGFDLSLRVRYFYSMY